MPSFSQFLVEEGYLTPQKLFQAIITQQRQTPPLLEMLCELRLVTESDLMQALGVQAASGCDLIRALERTGVWTPERREVLARWQSENIPPLWQILLEHGSISRDHLNKALDMYNQRKTDLGKPVGTAKPYEDSWQPEPVGLAFPTISTVLIQQYREIASDGELNELSRSIKGFGESKAVDSDWVSRIRTIGHGARFLGIDLSSHLLQDCIDLVERRGVISSLQADLVSEAIDIVGSLAQSLEVHRSESVLWEESSFADRWRGIRKRLKNTI